ncbi:sugar phosphate isomerase/epimerase family protein [Tessaracoccus coleopterorum]|uniref:sugar phosphate isomerase/epimerase family protein n=1 Tax=Tessaracoccus coleopterorum TaxID=2714950 RepID=UPI001E60CA3A|nr:hypothetical protein [Tessaracoccus coleopterorum]
MSASGRLSINQATIKHADLGTALRVTSAAGVGSIGLWREPVADVGLATAAEMLADSGLRMSTYCRGGFFTLPESPERRAALDDNRRAIEETATLAAAGADGSEAVLVLVAGGLPDGSRDLGAARDGVRAALDELAPPPRRQASRSRSSRCTPCSRPTGASCPRSGTRSTSRPTSRPGGGRHRRHVPHLVGPGRVRTDRARGPRGTPRHLPGVRLGDAAPGRRAAVAALSR